MGLTRNKSKTASPKPKKKRRWWREIIEWLVVLAVGAGLYFFVSSQGLVISQVMSNSMEPDYYVGDAVIYTTPENKEPQLGDVVIFDLPIDTGRTVGIVHRWIETSDSGKIYTKGDNNPQRDPWVIEKADIKGVAVGVIPTHHLRQVWIIPLAIALLVFAFSFRIILGFLSKDEDKESEDHARPAVIFDIDSFWSKDEDKESEEAIPFGSEPEPTPVGNGTEARADSNDVPSEKQEDKA